MGSHSKQVNRSVYFCSFGSRFCWSRNHKSHAPYL